MKRSLFIITALACFLANTVSGQNSRQEIRIPDIPGYQTLKGDFHMHTVFSDGEVWPVARVNEAWAEGLDVISITDHIEYHPHEKDVSIDQNRSYQIAEPEAKLKNIILVKGTEITKGMPPGHLNAIFIEDANLIDQKDYYIKDGKSEFGDFRKAIKAAIDQGAFIIWNHPGWERQAPDGAKWYDVHTELYEKGWIHGIEVANWKSYYPVVADWCNEKDLTMLGNSDIHISTAYMKEELEASHRPMTLVFAKTRDQEGVKEALFAKRTAVWSGDVVFGKDEILQSLFNGCVEVSKSYYSRTNGKEYFEIKNSSDLPINLKKYSSEQRGPDTITLKPGRTVVVNFKPSGNSNVKYKVENWFSGADKPIEVVLTFSVK
jgi:histidinol phosphatase-like PHP family hydrolase